ncbi:MAG: hypothetical protein ABIP38_06495 [Steroidobacteraceae bacterium]
MTLSYSSVLNKKHYLPDGTELDVGHTQSDTVGVSASYAPADRWLLVAGLPLVQTKFHGAGAHGPAVDHGHNNVFVTDLRLELRYQAVDYPVALAPFVAAVIPTNNYPVLGHAAPGRGLNEYWVGFFAGKTLEDWLPGAYVQMRYSYSFVEKVVGIRHDRSNLDAEIGYFFSPEWSVQAVGAWQWAHGGIDVPVPAASPLFPYHDQLAAAGFLNVTGGLAWFPTERHSVSLNYTQSLRGSNAHKVDRGISVAFGYRPRPR